MVRKIAYVKKFYGYDADVIVGITAQGEAVFYDEVDMTPTDFEIKNVESPTTVTTLKAIDSINGDSATQILPQNSQNSEKSRTYKLKAARKQPFYL